MNITILSTGLFPDPQTMAEAVSYLEAAHYVYRCDLQAMEDRDEEWDRVLEEVLGADRVITV
ncbi:MAG: hypothetical protein P8124_09915 [Gammaproteobacteria bacterium]